MNVQVTASRPEDIAVDTLVVFTTSYDAIPRGAMKSLDDASGNILSTLLDSEEFSGASGETVTLYRPDGYSCGRVIVAGLGAKQDVDADSFRRAMGVVSRMKGIRSVGRAALSFDAHLEPANVGAAVEGYLLGSFKLLNYKTGDDSSLDTKLESLEILVDKKSGARKFESAAERGKIIAEGQILARRLSATPANDLTPKKYAKEAQRLAKEFGFSCTVLDEKAIAKEKMGGVIAVGQGSAEPPRFLILEHKGRNDKQAPIVLVGKGVTFDTGGISLKPSLNMHEMKQDMTGSAVVLATLVTAARLGVKRNIVGLIPATENMPSGTAIKPGDIITMRKGKTVEIINTDAEGRLILADALDYANKYKPQAVIDIATLTGACLFILGYAGAPFVGNNSKLTDLIREAAANTAERVWEMPLWDDFKQAMKSDIADLVNSGGRPAGTLTAAGFLSNFVGDWPWAHIDIAYMDMEPKGTPYTPKGASGFGVRLLVDVLANWKKV
ncbi:leucyl aminopeptidase [candidate division GN15 bacterium]|nr:leucyl aminopeptidase [candidate division GN15 bacterium]